MTHKIEAILLGCPFPEMPEWKLSVFPCIMFQSLSTPLESITHLERGGEGVYIPVLSPTLCGSVCLWLATGKDECFFWVVNLKQTICGCRGLLMVCVVHLRPSLACLTWRPSLVCFTW